MDADGFIFFVDRIGDTFRWKGENVSTNEVQAAIAFVPGVREVNVYGVAVPHCEGRCGMAHLTLDPAVSLDDTLAALYLALGRDLPPYARPVFLRITTTGSWNFEGEQGAT